jgi:hypothetical protein
MADAFPKMIEFCGEMELSVHQYYTPRGAVLQDYPRIFSILGEKSQNISAYIK